MTLDEEIKHCEEVADYDCYGEEQLKCVEKHRQLAEWLTELKQLRERTRWIPCSERLPEYGEDVLVTRHFLSDRELKKDAITESFYVEIASYMDDEWTSYSDEYKIKRHLHKVIAWMPLPQPYR